MNRLSIINNIQHRVFYTKYYRINYRGFHLNVKLKEQVEEIHINSTPYTPKNLYLAKVKNGFYKKDEFQMKVVNELDKLYVDLLKLNNRNKMESSKGLINNMKSIFFKKESKQQIINDKTCIYLFGTVGTGKTMLMDLFYDSLPSTVPKRRVHFHAFMMEIHERIHQLKKNRPDISDPINPIAKDISKQAKILCFDELQVTDIADAMILRRLFDELFNNDVNVIITSNRHPDDLYKNGLQRKSFIPCIELLKQKCKVIDLNSGLDYRRMSSENNNLYLSPIDEVNQYKFNTLFDLFIDNNQPQQESITFLGRQLTVPYAYSGVAKFKFDELCYQPLNAADYIKLSEKYHTLFIENIPKLGLEDRNVSRRFITLLDALYENKNTLVCLSSTPLNELFTEEQDNLSQVKVDRLLMDDLGLNKNQLATSLFSGEEEKFALQRALSRLIQMQSITWLQMNSKAPNVLKNQSSTMDL